MQFTTSILICSFLTSICFAQRIKEQPVPDFTKGDKIGERHNWNLGPTGLRGWMWGWKLQTTKADQIYITAVDKGSPADGKFQIGDVLLGLAGKNFTNDPRHVLGNAIADAESTDGKLILTRWRAGKTEQVSIQLKILGKRSTTSPFTCTKSEAILKQGCEYIAKKLKDNLSIAKKRSWLKNGVLTRYGSNQIVEINDALALLASGEPKYKDIVKEYAQVYAPKNLKLEFSTHTNMVSWGWGYSNLFLCEYYLATGDKTVLPAIKEYSTNIAKGQSFIGSWGHSMAWPELNKGKLHGSLKGYGALNSAGLICHISLVLANKCGVQNDEIEAAIQKANKFIGFYTGKGSIPYGDHFPGAKQHDDNGKNSIAAILFDLQGMKEQSKFFTAMTIASYGERERGHTGNYFSFQWGALGAQRAGDEASTAFLKPQNWFYDLNRSWNGRFPYQGGANSGRGEHSYSGWDSTSSFMLTYALPKKQLYITGKEANDVSFFSSNQIQSIIEDGSEFTIWDDGVERYKNKSKDELLEDIKSWSPPVRYRATLALKSKKIDSTLISKLIRMLNDSSLHARYGACQALGTFNSLAKPAVPELIKLLDEDDTWLRIQAANALTQIGKDAAPAIPALLKLATTKDPSDPLQMSQRFLAFGLFDARATYNEPGLLSKSVEGIDRKILHEAIQQLLKNPDGRTRGTVASLYNNLSFEELRPLMPAILEAIKEPSPSGVMFANQIRLSGLKLLAKYNIEEGMALCFDTMEILKWGKKQRISQCLKILKSYGGAAKPMIPRLKQLEKDLMNHSEANALASIIKETRNTITTIENSKTKVKLLKITNQ